MLPLWRNVEVLTHGTGLAVLIRFWYSYVMVKSHLVLIIEIPKLHWRSFEMNFITISSFVSQISGACHGMVFLQWRWSKLEEMLIQDHQMSAQGFGASLLPNPPLSHFSSYIKITCKYVARDVLLSYCIWLFLSTIFFLWLNIKLN